MLHPNSSTDPLVFHPELFSIPTLQARTWTVPTASRSKDSGVGLSRKNRCYQFFSCREAAFAVFHAWPTLRPVTSGSPRPRIDGLLPVACRATLGLWADGIVSQDNHYPIWFWFLVNILGLADGCSILTRRFLQAPDRELCVTKVAASIHDAGRICARNTFSGFLQLQYRAEANTQKTVRKGQSRHSYAPQGGTYPA